MKPSVLKNHGKANPVVLLLLGVAVVALVGLVAYLAFRKSGPIVVPNQYADYIKQFSNSEKELADAKAAYAAALAKAPPASADKTEEIRKLLDAKMAEQAKVIADMKAVYDQMIAAAAAGDQDKYNALKKQFDDLMAKYAEMEQALRDAIAKQGEKPATTQPIKAGSTDNPLERTLMTGIGMALCYVNPPMCAFLPGLLNLWGDPEVREAIRNVAQDVAAGKDPNPEDLKKISQAAAKDPTGNTTRAITDPLLTPAAADPNSVAAKTLNGLLGGMTLADPSFASDVRGVLASDNTDATKFKGKLPQRDGKAIFENEQQRLWTIREIQKSPKYAGKLNEFLNGVEVVR